MLAEMLVQEGMRQIIFIITLYNNMILKEKSGASPRFELGTL